MKHEILLLFLYFTLFSCQKKESILETEKIALNTVFNEVVDSIYLKSTGSKIIAENTEKKTLVIYDSLTTNKPGYVELKARFKTIKNLYFDTISEKITPKIDLIELEKKANFHYKYKLSISNDSISNNFWNSKFALPRILIFSKINFDEEKKFGAFKCIYTNGNIYKAKHYLIYIQKEDDKWKLNEVTMPNVMH